MSLLVELANAQTDRSRQVVAGNPNDVLPWKEWTCYRGQAHITRLGGACTRYVDGREESVFGGTLFPSLAETELRTPYMRRVCRQSRWNAVDEEAMWLADLKGGLPDYSTGQPPDEPMACMDCRTYYVQLMERFSTHVEYRAGTGAWGPTGGYWVDLAELRQHKTLYASCVTRAWRCKTITLWKKGQPEAKRSTYLYQPQAYALLCDITHAWAYEAAVRFQAPRVAVDEVWVPVALSGAYSDWLASRWGLVSRVKSTWEPGDYWPLWSRDRLVGQSQLFRDRLAHGLTGGGGRRAAFSGSFSRGRLVLPA